MKTTLDSTRADEIAATFHRLAEEWKFASWARTLAKIPVIRSSARACDASATAAARPG
ncbi:MAG: hypothetical protein ACYC61_21935 [Isosphaeraceae bacterium]